MATQTIRNNKHSRSQTLSVDGYTVKLHFSDSTQKDNAMGIIRRALLSSFHNTCGGHSLALPSELCHNDAEICTLTSEYHNEKESEQALFKHISS